MPTLADLPPPPPGLTGWPWTVESPPLPARTPSGAEWPEIGIVTPSFNQARYLEAALRSVLLQGYPRLVYAVLDGGSNDGSAEIIRTYAPWLRRWRSARDGGQSQAINEGFAWVGGDVFGWLNSDDMLQPGALQALMQLRDARPEAVAWVGACHELNEQGHAVRTVAPRLPADGRAMGDWGQAAHFYQPACLFRRDAFERVGGLRESLHFVMDVDLWLRFAAQGAFAGTDTPVAAARLHLDAKTIRDGSMRECETIAVNVMNGAAEVARARLNRLLDEAAGRTTPRRRAANPLAESRYPFVAEGVAWKTLCRYLLARTVRDIRARLGGARPR